jgi:hypothetical protein
MGLDSIWNDADMAMLLVYDYLILWHMTGRKWGGTVLRGVKGRRTDKQFQAGQCVGKRYARLDSQAN